MLAGFITPSADMMDAEYASMPWGQTNTLVTFCKLSEGLMWGTMNHSQSSLIDFLLVLNT